MRIVGLPKPFYTLARYAPVRLSPQAEQRERALRCWQALRGYGCSIPEASRLVGVSRATLFRWQKRLKEQGPRGLEPRSRRPRRLRQPTWSVELAQAVLRLREAYPRWGKDKLAVLLRRQGREVSTSRVGRILRRLKARGVLMVLQPSRKRERTAAE